MGFSATRLLKHPMESQASLPVISAPSGDNTGGYLGEMCQSKIFDDTISNGQGQESLHHALEVYLVLWQQEGEKGLSNSCWVFVLLCYYI